MNDEKANLKGGLKNAVERGTPLELAKSSFVNGGYSTDEVEEASRSISDALPMVYRPPRQEAIPIKPLSVEMSNNESPKKFFSKKKILIFVMVVLVVLVGALFAGLLL